MQALEQAEELVSRLRRPEKAALLRELAVEVGEAFPCIEAIEGVCGGEACLVRTRIPVWLLVQARRLGTGEADLLRAYPVLRAEDLGHAWSYYRSHREEIEADIQANEEQAGTLRLSVSASLRENILVAALPRCVLSGENDERRVIK